MAFFKEIEKNIKISMKQQKTPIDKAFLRKKKRTGSITLSNFKLYHKTVVNKTVGYCH